MNGNRQYKYVGSESLKALLTRPSRRVCIRHPNDVVKWVETTNEAIDNTGMVVVTFIVDANQQLWINERRSEHVVCAAGQNVFSAGEMTFGLRGDQVEVVEVTNQSTGYCPEPESWSVVASVLEQIGITYPPDFTTAYIFRRCDKCGTTNIVKDMWFECAVCGTTLSQVWNFGT